ncbi:sulfotransferase domain-containing protein [Amaricoccus sp.]|uniref:sulfotransferase domain-containing protein n=1 Tax=Amaricoccus sp. TaxID=1872485 RepID=UPI002629CB9F|nr:sulfotransferase domain-containing protein [Amaricoccus sp.]HRO13021.1 sulfotransferase domain-containing protein [Amaricoccus sp.]
MALAGPVRRMLDGPWDVPRARAARMDARMLVRRVGHRLGVAPRVLPDFLVIGAQKSGTSSLFRYLDQHPQVRGSVPKEVHFFSGGLAPAVDAYTRGEAWYRAHFPKVSEMGEGMCAFEATPLYLLHPHAAARIHALMPGVKLVAVLRNPTDRALSHYFHNVRTNPRRVFQETLGPAEAMAAEEARLAPVLAAGDYRSEIYRVATYKARGRYLEQLRRYTALFPRENLLLLRAEDLFIDPAGQMRLLADFLGLEHVRAGVDFRAANVGDNRETVDPGVREELDAYFAPHNRALAEAFGRDFGW